MEVLHVPPRRREACHFVGSEQNRSPRLRFEDSFDVSKAEKAAVANKLRKGKGKVVRAPRSQSRRVRLSEPPQHAVARYHPKGVKNERQDAHATGRFASTPSPSATRMRTRVSSARIRPPKSTFRPRTATRMWSFPTP